MLRKCLRVDAEEEDPLTDRINHIDYRSSFLPSAPLIRRLAMRLP